MLNHEDNLNEPPQTAAQARVKTEEFAHAVASIEARKAEELRRLEGTVVLGEAIKDLQIEATPDEILAEVERNRREAETEQFPQSKTDYWALLRALRFSWRVLAVAVTISFLLGWLSRPTGSPVVTAGYVPSAVPQALYAPQFLPAPPPPSQSPLLNLAQIKDEQVVYCNSNQLEQMRTNSNFMVSPQSGDMSSFTDPLWVWPLIKHKGVLYVRGWVLGPLHAAFVKTHPIVFATARSAFDGKAKPQQYPEQVTLPIAGTRWSHDVWKTGSWQTLQVEGAELDSHAWEKW